MSRYECPVNLIVPDPESLADEVTRPVTIVAIAYGFDHACGFFFQGLDSDGETVIDLDTMFNKLSGPTLMLKLEEFDVHVPALHSSAMMLDMPF